MDPKEISTELEAARAGDESACLGRCRRFSVVDFHHCPSNFDRRTPSRRLLELVADRESGPSQGPALIVMDRLTEERIVATLECLVPDQRDVLLLRMMGGITVEEVAVVLGKTIGAVRALQRRALQTI